MSSPEDTAAMAPNKSKKGSGSVGTHEPSPDTPGPSGKRPFSEDDDFDYVPPKKGKWSSSKQSCKAGMRSPAYTPHNRPAELFRKDLISAMKLPDTDPLQAEDYLLIQDPWRQEWERGVQVPVNPADFQVAVVSDVQNANELKDFKMPRKFLHGLQDETYRQGIHELTGMQQLSEQVVRYDLDDVDSSWLKIVNERREEMGLTPVHEWTMEKVMERLENECHEKMSKLMRSEEILGIEYDANVACDVCRGKEGEDINEMVFCDGCNICVHQACYGIPTVPVGDWLCRPCALCIKPNCVLCPNKGGAMKSTKSGSKWAHVSCALWIPEVSIGIPEMMEPITKLSAIPASRWALVCCLCKKKQGACIQCSVKTCKTAFHVTCGLKGGLVFNTDLEDENTDGVKLRAFCPKHSKRVKEEPDSPSKDPKDMTTEEKETYRKQKLEELKEAFYTVIDCEELARQLQLDEEIIGLIFNFWKLKRKTNFNEPLLLPKADEAEVLENRQEKTIQSRMRMFVHLRQDLERVRNLCYMVSKREKMKRQYYNSHEALFRQLNEILTDSSLNISSREAERMAREFKTVVSPVVEPPPLTLRAPIPGRRRGRKKKSEMNSNNSNAGDDISNLEENSNLTVDTDSQDAPCCRQSRHILAHDTDTQMSFNYDSSEDNPSPPQLSPRVDEQPRAPSADDNDDDDAISCPDSVVDGADEQKEEEEEEVIVDSPPTPSPAAVSPSAVSSPATPPSPLPALEGPAGKTATQSTPRLKLSLHMRPLSAAKAGGQRWAKPRAARRHRRLFGRRRKVPKKPESCEAREPSKEAEQEPMWETVPMLNSGKRLKLSLTKRRQVAVKREEVSASEESGARGSDADAAVRHSERLETRQGRGSGLSKHGQGEAGAREASPEQGSPHSATDVAAESAGASSLESARPHRSTRAHVQPDQGVKQEGEAKELWEPAEEEVAERRRPRQNGKLQRAAEARQPRTTRPRTAPKFRQPGAVSPEQKHDLRLSSRREPHGPVSGGKDKGQSALQTGGSASERLQELLGSQDLKLTDEVLTKMRKSMSGVMGKHFNGHHAHEVPDSSVWKLDGNGRVKLDSRGKPLLNSQPSSRASSRVLNEISADKRKKTENVFGRSLPEQRLSRKALASATATRTPGRPLQQDSPAAQARSCGKREWPRHGDTALTPFELRSVKKNIFGEFEGLVPSSHTPDFRSLRQGPVEAPSRQGSYRCGSPLSDDGDVEQRDFSRESTPRRVTRSQHLDPDENSLGNFPQKTSATPPRLKESLLKSSKFS